MVQLASLSSIASEFLCNMLVDAVVNAVNVVLSMLCSTASSMPCRKMRAISWMSSCDELPFLRFSFLFALAFTLLLLQVKCLLLGADLLLGDEEQADATAALARDLLSELAQAHDVRHQQRESSWRPAAWMLRLTTCS